MKKKSKIKKPSVAKLKKKLWKLFSEYIRKSNANFQEYVTCVTCPITKHWKEMQAGHFIPGRHNSILFDERNVHVQCYGCNVHKQGNTVKYFRFMEKKYGHKVIKELEKLDLENKQFTTNELEKLIEIYKKKLKLL